VTFVGLETATVAWREFVGVTVDVIDDDFALASELAAVNWRIVTAQSGPGCAATHHTPVEKYPWFR
jgi:hypothetical protein